MPNSCSAYWLMEALDSTELPQVFDVRRAPAFAASDSMIERAVWRDPELVDGWAGEVDRVRRVIVYCVHGHEVSQGVAKRLQSKGVEARFLAGGFEAWRVAGGAVARRLSTPGP